MPSFYNQPDKIQTRGFTLIEMIVVIGIFLVMTGILLANLPKFKDKTNLDLIAQEMAITIRQAQVYGVGVHTFSSAESSCPNDELSCFPSFGVYLNSGIPKNMVIFGDTNADKKYTFSNNANSNNPGNPFVCSASNPECLEVFNIQGTAFIDNIKATDGAPLNQACIVYVRPNPEPVITDCDDVFTTYKQLKVTLTSKTGDSRVVTVFKNGQIRVEAIPTP